VRPQRGALANDAHKAGEAEQRMAQLHATLAVARDMLAALRRKVPPDVRFNANSDIW
jgi:hypothetical protein